jgi:hypothetical protein
MDSSKLMGLINKIKEHGKPGQVAFLAYGLLTEAGYTDDEIRETGTALTALVQIMREE